MASSSLVSPDQDILVKPADLRFDLQNPRMPNESFNSEAECIEYLIAEFDIEELVQSIMASGWIDYEPMIIEKSTNVVFEGNRRLAALRLICDASTRTAQKYNLPFIENAKLPPTLIRARPVSTRAEARRFIAFKHINGPMKWDAYAKARYAASWLGEGESIEIVSRMLGDNHNTIRRLVAGYNVLEQAQDQGFDLTDRSKKRFAFSHLYTAVSRPAVRNFLGLEDEEIGANPVPIQKKEQLAQMMSWLYGQEKKNEPTVVSSQNPNLNQLVRVIENDTALSVLVKSRRLDQAFEQVEPPSLRFRDALISASKQCEDALGLSSHYDGDDTQLAMCRNLAFTVRNLRDAMQKKKFGEEGDL